MACSGCASGRGCHTTPGSVPAGCNDNGSCGTGGCNKLNVFDWLANMSLPDGQKEFDMVEIRFKNSRKEFFRNVNNIAVAVGEVVAVEGTPGHDIGVVSASGELVRMQMKKKNVRADNEEIKKLYRKAKPADVDKWREAQALETATMYRARTLALNLNLQMKISDVEYQGDKTKAIFYYTAEDRVDFRELIKVMADEFKIRVEMKQIGARQEAARLGGIGACGRELCCSTWLNDFRTVSTSAARYQQLSLNPMKLAGQCGKLKCCLNYELDSYVDALKDFPETDNVKLRSKRGSAFHQKTDIFRRIIWYSYEGEGNVFIPLPVERVKEVMAMNVAGEFPEELAVVIKEKAVIEKTPDYENVVGQDSLTRFDRTKKQGQQNRNRNKNQQRHNNPNKTVNPNQQAKPANTNPNANKNNPNQNPNKNPNPNQNRNRNNNNRNPNNRNNSNNNNNPTPPPPSN